MSWWTVPDAPPAEAQGIIYVIEPRVVGQNLVYIVSPSYFMGRIAIIPEQDIARDSGEIMIQAITQTYFQDNIKKFIPYEYWRMDAKTIDEGGSEGDFAAFTEVFAITLDEIKQAIDEFPLLFDIEHCPARYLRVIAELLNFPLEDSDSTAEQRRQLKEAINWYRSKGSRRAFTAILYAFGFYATMVPLWTEDYSLFTDTIPGVAKGNDPPNDYPLLVENGGTWYRSPHYGILLEAIVEDRNAFIEWGSVTENEIPIFDEFVSTDPDGVETSFSGTIEFTPAVASTFTGDAFVAGWPVTDIVDDGAGNLSGTDITGTIDYDTGAWTLEFVTPPSDGSVIRFNYSYDWTDLVEDIGYHRAFYQMLDQLTRAGVALNYQFDSDSFNYIYRRLEFLRPVFAVLEWLGFQVGMNEYFEVPEGEEPMMTANPVRDEKGWYLGYCDMDDVQYTRLDERLLGPNMRTLTSPLGAGSPTVIDVVDEVAFSVTGSPSFVSGTLANSWLFSDVTFTATIGSSPVDITDIQDEEVVYATVVPVVGEIISSDPDGIETSFSGSFVFQPTINSFETVYADLGSGAEEITLLNDDEGNLTGTCSGGTITGTVNEFDALWTLEFPVAPVSGTNLVADYTFNDTAHGEIIDTSPDGVETNFSGTLDQLPLTTGGVLALQADYGFGLEEMPVIDDGIGGLTGTDPYGNGFTGTINYGTGAWTLALGLAPEDGSNLILRYTYPVAEGVLKAEGVIGVLDYLDGSWWLEFESGYEPDDSTDIVVDYSYSNEIPPTDRSGIMPRGSTELPFPHVRDPQEGYCHPPEELWIDWYWIQPEQYTLALTRDGMNLYPPAGPVLYIDHADFPSRGFTNTSSDPGHANTFTRELGYSDRAISLLKVEQNPPASAEDWQNQDTAWESWTGPWENLGD